jgi:NAD(P)-dependent dehydrogenase (short-subunit alcohol dehydrogenase family)
VLIVGASKGMGNGAAQAFTSAGANVIGTSRFPSDYSGQPWLSPVPLDITVDDSVENFFNTDPTLATWDHIDILILSGNVPPWGSLMYLKAADLFPMINCEILGRHRVVERAIKMMYFVDESRIITISSLASFFTENGNGVYGATKGAVDGWVKTWNAQREWFKLMTGSYDKCKTIAIAIQPAFVNTTFGQLPPSLCDPIPSPLPYGSYPSANSAFDDFSLAPMIWLQNGSAQGLQPLTVGKAMLYAATKLDPEWRYAVIGQDEFCSGGKTASVECYIKKLTQHKFKDAVLELQRGYNWNAAYHNMIYEGNSKQYSFYKCPPLKASAPAIAVPFLPSGYPDCEGGPVPGTLPNITVADNVADLTDNQCKPINPCD